MPCLIIIRQRKTIFFNLKLQLLLFKKIIKNKNLYILNENLHLRKLSKI